MGIKVSREFLLSKKSNFIRFRSNFSYLDRLGRRLASTSKARYPEAYTKGAI